MSKLTLLPVLFFSIVSYAGTVGTPDSEIQRLEDEVAEARNERDTQLLKKDAKPSDPAVVEKERVVEEKLKALQSAFRKRVTVSSTSRAQSNSSPAEPVDVPASAPGTPLSGEGIQSEIQYKKKEKQVRAKSLSAPTPSPSPDSAEVNAPTALTGEGVTEIQYSKKAKPTPRPLSRPSPLTGKQR